MSNSQVSEHTIFRQILGALVILVGVLLLLWFAYQGLDSVYRAGALAVVIIGLGAFMVVGKPEALFKVVLA